MSMIPASLTRVPNILATRAGLSQITRTNLEIFRATEQLSTGRAVIRPSDDAVKTAAILELDGRLGRAEQRTRNLDVARGALATLDVAISQAQDMLLEAKAIAHAQLGFGASAEERAGQAAVVDSLLGGLIRLANTSTVLGHVFGGDAPGRPAVDSFLGGVRFRGAGSGITADLGGLESGVRLTLGDNGPLGSVSGRVRGVVDLSPGLTTDTRLADLDGARGLGVELGSVEFSSNDGPRIRVDLSQADTVGHVLARITAAVRAHETETGQTILGPEGVGVSGGAISIDLADQGGAGATLRFFEVGAGVTARDLGLAADTPIVFAPGSAEGLETSPRLTWLTPVSVLRGVDDEPLGRLRITAHGQSRLVDLSSATTMQDIRNAIEGSGLGLRVEIDRDGTLSVLSEVSGGAASGVSIEEVEDGGATASRLGIRTLDLTTRLNSFNDGRGVKAISGSVAPDTGEPDASLDVDFVIELGNGVEVEINLSPADVVTVGAVVAAINSQAAAQLAALGLPTTLLRAGLPEHGPGGIRLEQDSSWPGMTGNLRVDPRNNSPASAQLGLLDGSWDAESASLTGSDRAKVRVDSVFTHLIGLRDTLLADDSFGITLAAEGIERAIDRLAQSRALVGGYMARVEREVGTVEQRRILDETFRSQLRDADYAEVASRFALLQTQLSAGLQVAAVSNSMSLLDFLR